MIYLDFSFLICNNWKHISHYCCENPMKYSPRNHLKKNTSTHVSGPPSFSLQTPILTLFWTEKSIQTEVWRVTFLAQYKKKKLINIIPVFWFPILVFFLKDHEGLLNSSATKSFHRKRSAVRSGQRLWRIGKEEIQKAKKCALAINYSKGWKQIPEIFLEVQN